MHLLLKIFYCICFIYFTLATTSCGDMRIAKNVEEEERKHITKQTVILDMNNNHIDSFPINKLICDVKYIPLETTEQCVLSTPMNVKSNGKLFFVSDLDENLFCFDSEGKFIRNMFKKGKGHGEIVRMYDFDVDDNYVYILDGTISALNRFSHDGVFVDCVKLPFRALRFLRYDEGYIFQLAPYGNNTAENLYQIATTDDSFHIMNQYFEYDLKHCIPVTRTPYFTHSYNNGVLFSPMYARSLYHSTSHNELKMDYYFEFNGPYYEPSKYYNGANEAKENNIYYNYANALQTKDYTLQVFDTSINQRSLLLINNVTHRNILIRNFIQNYNMVYNFNFISTKFYDKKEDYLITFADQYYVGVHDENIKEIYENISGSVINNIVKTTAPFSNNPVLILYRLCPNII